MLVLIFTATIFLSLCSIILISLSLISLQITGTYKILDLIGLDDKWFDGMGISNRCFKKPPNYDDREWCDFGETGCVNPLSMDEKKAWYWLLVPTKIVDSVRVNGNEEFSDSYYNKHTENSNLGGIQMDNVWNYVVQGRGFDVFNEEHNPTARLFLSWDELMQETLVSGLNNPLCDGPPGHNKLCFYEFLEGKTPTQIMSDIGYTEENWYCDDDEGNDLPEITI